MVTFWSQLPGRRQGKGNERKSLWRKLARVAELADALDLGGDQHARSFRIASPYRATPSDCCTRVKPPHFSALLLHSLG